MKEGIYCGNIDEYDAWVEDNIDPCERYDYFYVGSVDDLFNRFGITIRCVGTWHGRSDLYEMFDYVESVGNVRNFELITSGGDTFPLGSTGTISSNNTTITSNNHLITGSNTIGQDTSLGPHSVRISCDPSLGSQSIGIGQGPSMSTLLLDSKSIEFRNPEEGDLVGVLSWENGYFEFKGDAKESAKTFFEGLKNVSEDIIEDRYIKRTLTFSEYASQEEKRDELVEKLREQLFLDCDRFIKNNKIEGMDEDIKNFVNKVAIKCLQTFNNIVK